MGKHNSSIKCEIYQSPDLAWLEQAWLTLEKQAEPNLFISWLWIGSWMKIFVQEFYLVEATVGGKSVGLGIVTKKKKNSLLGDSYYLHRIGDELSDQIWIEYNDFLLLKGSEDSVRKVMISTIMEKLVQRGSLVIGASVHLVSKDVPYSCDIVWDSISYQVDFNALRKKKLSVSQSLSRNSRYQINRSIKNYQKIGKITVHAATTIEEAKSFIELASELHKKQWGKGLGQSGFANDRFIMFHLNLIENGLLTGIIEIYKVTVGNKVISIMYYFKSKGTVYFYLSALNYNIEGVHLKPGLVSHYLLMCDALNNGCVCYDFMGGISRYKRTFSNKEQSLSVYRIFKLDAKNVIHRKMRTLKHRIMEFKK